MEKIVKKLKICPDPKSSIWVIFGRRMMDWAFELYPVFKNPTRTTSFKYRMVTNPSVTNYGELWDEAAGVGRRPHRVDADENPTTPSRIRTPAPKILTAKTRLRRGVPPSGRSEAAAVEGGAAAAGSTPTTSRMKATRAKRGTGRRSGRRGT